MTDDHVPRAQPLNPSHGEKGDRPEGMQPARHALMADAAPQGGRGVPSSNLTRSLLDLGLLNG